MASIQPLTFSQLLRRFRRAAGLTQEELAERAGLSVTGISAIERGINRGARRDTVELLAQALHLSPHEQALFEDAARGRPTPPAQTAPPPHAKAPLASNSPPGLPLVGRSRELAVLERHLTPTSRGVALLMAGEPGIGKTRLLQEASRGAAAAGWHVLTGGCTRRSGQEPYSPLLETIAGFLRTRTPAQLRADLDGCAWLVRLLPELAEQAVVPAPSWSLPPEQERRLMFAAVARFLANVAGPAGTLLVLDDLQWASADALHLLTALLQPAGTQQQADSSQPRLSSLRLLGAYRSTEVHAQDPLGLWLSELAARGQALHLTLDRLPAEAAAELLELLLARQDHGDTVGEHPHTARSADGAETSTAADLRQRVLQRAEGVPFFLVSCAQGMLSGVLAVNAEPLTAPAVGAQGADSVPWDVAQSIRVRVAALPEPARLLLGLAAVAGRVVLRRDLFAVALHAGRELPDHDAALAALDAVTHAGLLVETSDEAYAFAHDLIREVILTDLSRARRAAWHRRVGEALERLPEGERAARVAELAWHFARADQPARALPYALVAGDRAEAAYAHAEAEQHYTTSTELARAVGDARSEAVALEKLGGVQYTLGRQEDALTAYERATQLYRRGGDRDQYIRSTISCIECCLAGGDLELTAQRLRMLLRLVGDGWEPCRLGTDWDPLRADEMPDLSCLAARTAARLCDLIAQCNLCLGWGPDALAAADRAVAFAHAAGDAACEAAALVRRGLVLGTGRTLDDQDSVGEALAAWQEADRLANAAGDLHLQWKALMNCAQLESQRGAIEEANRLYSSTLQAVEQWGAPADVAITHGFHGQALVVDGRWAEARAHFEVAQRLGATVQPSYQTASGTVLYAWLAHLQGQPEAPGLIDQAFALARQFNHYADLPLYLVVALAESDLLAGLVAAARSRVESLLAAEGGRTIFGSLAVETALIPLLAWALAEQGDVQKAGMLVREVSERARRVGYRPALADALHIQAVLATRQGHWHEAEAALLASLALCRAIPYPYCEAKVLYVYGQFHAAKGDTEQAREQYEAAIAICERLGEGLYRPHIERALAELE